MGKRDNKYTLLGSVEVDEGFFSTEIPDEQKDEPLKRGAGSQAKTKVLAMAESAVADNPKKGQKPQKAGHIKMVVIPDSKKETIDPIASTDINGGCHGSERRYKVAHQLSKDAQRICREVN